MCLRQCLSVRLLPLWRKKIYTPESASFTSIFVPSDLELKFAPLVTLVQHNVSTKLQVSMAFLFQENQRQGTSE